MRFEFPVPIVQTQFGPVIEPVVEIPLKLVDGYLSVRFFVDTGADVSMLPRSFAEYCGVDLAEAPPLTVTGIEGRGIDAWVGSITVRISDDEITIPCLFTTNENTPAVLGRAGVLERYSILFDASARKIVFESV